MNNTTAIVAVTLGSLAAVVLVVLFRPNADNAVLIGLIFAAAVPTTTGLLSFIKSEHNATKLDLVDQKVAENTAKTEAAQGQIQRLSITVDGRLSQLLDARSDASHAAGVHQGEQDERDRSSTLTGPTTIAAEGPTTISTQGPVTVVGKTDERKNL